MNCTDSIWWAMRDTKTSMRGLARVIGHDYRPVHDVLQRKDCLVSTLLEMLSSLGYEVVVMPKSNDEKTHDESVCVLGFEAEGKEEVYKRPKMSRPFYLEDIDPKKLKKNRQYKIVNGEFRYRDELDK